MTPQEWAQEIARCWARPRTGGFPPSAPLEYMAEMAYWQACHLYGFNDDLPAWIQAVQAALDPSVEAARSAALPTQFTRAPPSPRIACETNAAEIPASCTMTSAPELPPIAPNLSDLEEWLNQ